MKDISAGSVPDRSFPLLPLLPLLSRLHPSLSHQSSLPTWWQLQSGFYLRELVGGEGLGEGRGEGHRMRKTDSNLPPPPNHFLLTSSDLSSLEEESQCESCYGEIPEPPFRFPPRGPPLHLRAPHSQLWTQPTKSRLQTYFVPSKVSSGMFATQPLGRERGKKSEGFFLNLMVCFLPVSRPLLSLSVGPAGRDPPIRPLRGPAFRLTADEGLQPKIWEDCVPLKASCRQWAGREAAGSPLPRPLPSRAPLTRGETDKPSEGQTQSRASRAAPSPPPFPRPENQVSPQAQPTNHPPRPTPFLPSSPSQVPEKKWEGVTGDACLAPTLWEWKELQESPGAHRVFKELLYSIKTATCLLAPVCEPLLAGGGGEEPSVWTATPLEFWAAGGNLIPVQKSASYSRRGTSGLTALPAPKSISYYYF